LLDQKKIDQTIANNPLSSMINSVAVRDLEFPIEMLDKKTAAGFETVMMMLIDDKDPERRQRAALLSNKLRFIAIS